MIAKVWKKVLLIIVVVACLFNVVAKLATKISFAEEIDAVVSYVKTIENKEDANTNSRKCGRKYSKIVAI